jgi:hypothetical protein
MRKAIEVIRTISLRTRAFAPLFMNFGMPRISLVTKAAREQLE